MLFKIIGVGLTTVILNLILRQYKSDFAFLVNVCGGLVMFALLTDGMSSLVEDFINLQSLGGIKLDIVSPILKVIGIGYITEWTADIAEDCGNKSIADKIIIGGKIAICLLALPIIKTLISSIISII